MKLLTKSPPKIQHFLCTSEAYVQLTNLKYRASTHMSSVCYLGCPAMLNSPPYLITSTLTAYNTGQVKNGLKSSIPLSRSLFIQAGPVSGLPSDMRDVCPSKERNDQSVHLLFSFSLKMGRDTCDLDQIVLLCNISNKLWLSGVYLHLFPSMRQKQFFTST